MGIRQIVHKCYFISLYFTNASTLTGCYFYAQKEVRIITPEKMTEKIMECNEEISALKESIKSAHKRIDEVDETAKGIHSLTTEIASLTMQIKQLTGNINNSITKLEESIRRLGVRLGELEKAPADKWKALVGQVVTIVVAAAISALIAGLK